MYDELAAMKTEILSVFCSSQKVRTLLPPNIILPMKFVTTLKKKKSWFILKKKLDDSVMSERTVLQEVSLFIPTNKKFNKDPAGIIYLQVVRILSAKLRAKIIFKKANVQKNSGFWNRLQKIISFFEKCTRKASPELVDFTSIKQHSKKHIKR